MFQRTRKQLCRSAGNHATTNHRRLRLEPLEDRRLLSVGVTPITASLLAGTLEAGTQVVPLRFGEPVLNANTAANYELRAAGADGLLGSADDRIVPLTVCYRESVSTLCASPGLSEDVYRLTVRDAITDLSGNKLDGDGNGTAGGDWVRDFVVTPSSRLFDGTPNYPSGGTTPQSVATGDFNGDRIADVVVANSSGSVSVLLANGSGGFLNPMTVSIGANSPMSLAVGDFNADGKSDVVVANSGNSTVTVLLGNGVGGFTSSSSFACGGVGYGAQAVAIADFNGDGDSDVVIANGWSNTVGVMFGNGVGGLGLVTQYPSGGNFAYSLAVEDFNSDGRPDVAVCNVNDGITSVMLNDGSGRFVTSEVYANSYGTSSLAASDFNGDGIIDLALGIGTDIGVCFGDDSGRFGQVSVIHGFPGTGRAYSLLAADLNGDGAADLASNGVCVAVNDGKGVFSAPVRLFTGALPDSLAVGDFNADGRLDLVAANRGSNSLGILLGVGDGSFAFTSTLPLAGGYADRLVSVDLNRDGQLDLIVAGYSSYGVDVLLGNGSGRFANPVNYATGGKGFYPAIGDFNNDGTVDVVVTNYDYFGGTASVLLGNGNGGFGAPITFATGGSNPTRVAVADFNNDGKSDLAIINASSNNVATFLGNGDGSFTSSTILSSGIAYARSVAIGDFNGDGNDDMVMSVLGDSLLLFLGMGTGQFGIPTSVPGGSSPEGLLVRDLNGDHRSDLLVINRTSNVVSVLLGKGTGSFASPVSYYVNAFCPNAGAWGDYNLDGKLDLALSTDYGAVSVLLGDGNGAFTSFSATFASGGTAACDVVSGDFNRDGQPDIVVGGSAWGGVAPLSNIYGPAPQERLAPGGTTFDIATGNFGSGEIVQGSNNAFDGYGRLMVGGAAYRPTLLNATTSDGGRTVVTGEGTTAGLTVSRQVTVPNTGSQDFARTIDSFTNNTGAAITTTVTIVGNLGSDAATTVFGSSDGDTTVETSDQWFGTDDADGIGTPAVIHYIHGPLGLRPTSVNVLGDNLSWTYDITVQPGQTAQLSSFAIVATSRSDAIAAANALVTPTSFGGQAAAFLSTAEQAALANFQFYVATTTGLSGPPWATGVGQTATFTAAVSAVTPGSGVPTGSVVFKEGTTPLGTVAVDSSGVAVLNTAGLGLGTHTITATYQGDSNFTLSNANNSVSHTVVLNATNLALTTATNPSVYGQRVLFSAAVSAAPGVKTPSGWVTFKDGDTILGREALLGGVAQLYTTALPVGSRTVTAFYEGNSTYAPSINSVAQTVNRQGTTVSLATSTSVPVYGQNLIFYANVKPVLLGTGPITGTVSFMEGGTLLGTAPVSALGQAKFTTSTLNFGAHTITAVYNGDANFVTGSDSILRSIGQAGTTATLTSSTTSVTFGQLVTLRVVLDAVSPSTAIPTGVVVFKDGVIELGTAVIDSNGVATLATSALSVGTHKITGVYAGNANFKARTTSIVTIKVLAVSGLTLTTSAPSMSTSVTNASTANIADVALTSLLDDWKNR